MKHKPTLDDPFGPFDFSQFKKWINEQHESKNDSIIHGIEVESKISFKKLLDKIIETEDGELLEVAKSFRSSGGTITEVDGHTFRILTKQGSFLIDRTYVTKKDY